MRFIPKEGEYVCADNVGESADPPYSEGAVGRILFEKEVPETPGREEDAPDAEAEDVELAEDMDDEVTLTVALTPCPGPEPTAFNELDGGGEKNLEVGGGEML